MAKKIVILNGSPRPNGNTAALVEAFSKGAQESGNEVVCFSLQRMNIHPCLGCCKGGKNPESPCVQKDDMEIIYQAYLAADVLVLASPMYSWSVSAQLKCAFDRLFAVAECDPKCRHPHKECILLMPACGNDFEETLFWYERVLKYLRWTDAGKVLCGGVMNIGDIAGNPKLEEALTLGRSIK